YYLEVLALLDYLEVYKPCIDGIQPPAESVDNCMGIFTSIPQVAQYFFDAGLPVWFMRETDIIAENPDNAPNVLALFELCIPHDFVTMQDTEPLFPAVYKGSTDRYQKHAAIHTYSRTWMVYCDVFAAEASNPVNVEEPIDPFTLPRGPAQRSVTIPMQDLLKECLPSSLASSS
ncbi:hypothetical protein APHAL10511_004256, partial [Amanita phalloides]